MLDFFHKKLQSLKLHQKITLTYLLVILLPIVVIGYYLFVQTVNTSLANNDYTNAISCRQINANMINQLTYTLDQATNINYEHELIDYLQQPNTETDFFDKYTEFKDIYDRYAQKWPITTGTMKTMSFFTTNDSIIADDFFIINACSVQEENWYNEAITADGKCVFIDPYVRMDTSDNLYNGDTYFAVTRLMKYASNEDIINVLRLEIPEQELYRLIEKELNKEIYLLNGDDIVVTSTNRDSIGRNANIYPALKDVLLDKPPMDELQTDSEGNAVYYNEVDENIAIHNWKVIILISSEPLIADLYLNVVTTGLIIFVIGAITLIILNILSKRLTSRISLLANNMTLISDGDFTVHVPMSGNDEVAELTRGFKNMIEQIDNLITKVYTLDLRTAKAEFKALQSQINPHFLFNTMESIRMNLIINGDEETSQVIHQFSQLLRSTISNDKAIISLSRELELVNHYLTIQKYRYCDQFNYDILIDPKIYEMNIPKLTLQPLVENAIHHGLELKKGVGHLFISSEILHDKIEISIEDNGVGIAPKKLIAIQSALYTGRFEDPNHIGLTNVHHRIRLQYGDKYGLRINSKLNVGTKVDLILPLLNRGE